MCALYFNRVRTLVGGMAVRALRECGVRVVLCPRCVVTVHQRVRTATRAAPHSHVGHLL
jgi:hypothetical protein